jgi:hypothetical protein
MTKLATPQTSMSAEMQQAIRDYMAGLAPKQHASSAIGLDRLVRKEESLGAIREIQPPTDHIGLGLFPFMQVETDDVIFDYIRGGLVDGMSPARAEDAESELSQKDDLTYGQGRASVIDWAEKDKYTASDVTRYNELNRLAQLASGAGVTLQLGDPGRAVEQFNAKVARDDARRSRKLYNRIEWMIQQALWTGGIAYNDGKIKFAVDYGRPAGQQGVALASGFYDTGTTHDPIGDIIALNQAHYNTYGTYFTRAITSRKVLNTFWKSDRWIARVGLVVGGTPSAPIDPNYLAGGGITPDAAIAIVQQQTGVTFTAYDSVYRTRPFGTSTIVNTRFSPERQICFLPTDGDLAQIDDTTIGFGKVLTAPHPEGNFTSGFYEWEKDEIDPWMRWRGTGIKAFPVFPYLEYSVVANALSV